MNQTNLYLNFAGLDDYLNHLKNLGIDQTHNQIEIKSGTADSKGLFSISLKAVFSQLIVLSDKPPYIATCSILCGRTLNVMYNIESKLPESEQILPVVRKNNQHLTQQVIEKGFEVIPGQWASSL